MPNFYIKRNAEDYKEKMKRLGYRVTTSSSVKKLKSGRKLTIFTVTIRKR